jgi:plastocyanin
MKKLIGSKSRFLIGMFLLVSIITIPESCSKSSMASLYGSNTSGTNGTSGTPGANEVWIQNMAFSPSIITVAAGTTITWTNKDGMAHTVTSDTNLFDSGNISSNGSYTHTFTASGTYPYHCAVHLDMTASVKVN